MEHLLTYDNYNGYVNASQYNEICIIFTPVTFIGNRTKIPLPAAHVDSRPTSLRTTACSEEPD